jgi:hypothetical protein
VQESSPTQYQLLQDVPLVVEDPVVVVVFLVVY